MAQKQSTGSKIFTAVFSVFLVVLLVFALIYVALAEDFTAPEGGSGDVEIDDDVWNYDMDDLLAYFDELGLMDSSTKQLMSTVGTENWICNGVDLIWWDVENLVEGTEEYEYWYELQENDNIYVMFANTVYTLNVNGPFAYHDTSYPGDSDELYEAFYAFPSAWSGAAVSSEE